MIRYLTKISYIENDQPGSSLKENELSFIHDQSVVYRIAVGKRFSFLVMKSKNQDEIKVVEFRCMVNIHDGVFIHEKKREKLLILCRYISRGSISKQRFERINGEKVAVRFKRVWSNGVRSISKTF